MVEYRPRGVERLFSDPNSLRSVVVLQGARAVGKTSMVRHLVETGLLNDYQDLSEPTTRLAAAADPEGWLRRLERPFVVDEAQLLPELPLAVKRIVDEQPPGLQAVLTGSATIGRTGLGGSDPLLGRAERVLLHPFSAQEAVGLKPTSRSVVDLLFDAPLGSGSERYAIDDDLLLAALERGGMPHALFSRGSSRRSRFDQVDADLRGALRPELRPEDRFDSGRASDLLDALLTAPGGLLNFEKLSSRLEFDRRTVERLLDVLEERFLLSLLPNLALSASRQLRRSAKVHPMDTSMAAAALNRAGVDLRTDRERFGAMLETRVVQQLLAAADWAEREVRAWYWRRTSGRTAEVDLVLESANVRVAVEVKATRTLSGDDLRGLDSLHASTPLDRAYIAYLGDEIRQLRASVWAVPVEALLSGAAFEQKEQKVEPPITIAATRATHGGDASMLVSYVRDDDEFLGGAMTAFARELARSYRFRTGRGIDVFIDQDDLGWGRDFQQQLDRAADQTTFLLVMVTPNYLRSDPCRREFERFLAAAAASPVARERLILSLIWTPIDGLVDEDDPIVQEIRRRQYLTGEHLLALTQGSPEYRQAALQVADRLRLTVEQQENAPQSVDDGTVDDEEVDLLEAMGLIDDARAPIELAATRLGQGMAEIGRLFEEAPPLPTNDALASAAALQRLGVSLQPAVDTIDEAGSLLSATWAGLESQMGSVIDAVSDIGTDEERADLALSLRELGAALELPDSDQFLQIARTLGRLSRHLRPLGRSLEDTLRIVETIRRGAEGLAARLRPR